jgi:CelD/BcsL family acetyltransferase involved in cellulose biosynthesis/glycosyltransferase involved in cell wall biosynthesis
MSMTILSVAYPLAPVSEDAVGGAEQVLSAIDAALVREGHRSLVVACRGSTVAGELFELPACIEPLCDATRSAAQAACRALIEDILRNQHVDVVHFHGLDFHTYLPEHAPPILCTLHLPPDWYPAQVFTPRPGVYLHCVSAAQRARCPRAARLLDDIPNGVDLARFRPGAKDGFALVLGRLCPEKGVHLALEAARRAGLPLRIAGRVFAYPEHQRYFAERIAPLLDEQRTFIGPARLHEKTRLLAAASCVVVPSQVAETSSLVAMEALASGTPVVASRLGALPDLIRQGVTGFVADSVDELATAMSNAHRLSPAACRRDAEQRFSVTRMCRDYLALYARIAPRRRRPQLQLHELRSKPALHELEAEWLALWQTTPRATTFQSPEWLLPWSAQLLDGEIRVLTFRSDGELLGVAPFFSWRDGAKRVLSLMGAGVSDYADVLFAPGARAACLGALERWLLDTRSAWDRLEWSELPDGSPLLATSLGAGRLSEQAVCPGVLLNAPLAELMPRQRYRQLAYARRRAERDCGLEYVPASEANLDTLLRALEQLHGRRWQLRSQTGMLGDARVRSFQRAAARRLLARDRLLLHGVQLAGELAAVLFGFHDPQATRFYLSGFEPRFAKHSPGQLAIAHAMELAAARGSPIFDFLRGAEPYKYDWGARDLGRVYRRELENIPEQAALASVV